MEKSIERQITAFENDVAAFPLDELRKLKKKMTLAAASGKPVYGGLEVDTRIAYAINQELGRRATAKEEEGETPKTTAEQLARITRQPVAAIEKHLVRDKTGKRHARYFAMLEEKDQRYQQAAAKVVGAVNKAADDGERATHDQK